MSLLTEASSSSQRSTGKQGTSAHNSASHPLGSIKLTSTSFSLICASAKQKQQIIKMQMLWNVFQVSAVELERARVQLISANEIIECG